MPLMLRIKNNILQMMSILSDTIVKSVEKLAHTRSNVSSSMCSIFIWIAVFSSFYEYVFFGIYFLF